MKEFSLLIVDFNQDIPKIYNTDEELRQDGLIALKFNGKH